LAISFELLAFGFIPKAARRLLRIPIGGYLYLFFGCIYPQQVNITPRAEDFSQEPKANSQKLRAKSQEPIAKSY
jgi:hypothetical protein